MECFFFRSPNRRERKTHWTELRAPILIFSILWAGFRWNEKHITRTMQTVKPASQSTIPVILQKISVQLFNAMLYSGVVTFSHGCRCLCVCVSVCCTEQLNNVKVTFISIVWINFSRKINNNLFSILAIYVCIQFWFLFSLRFCHTNWCGPANSLGSWDNFYFHSFRRSFGCCIFAVQTKCKCK